MFYKIFPQEFPTRISHKISQSRILIGWLNITLFQILNFHQSLPLLNWLFPSTMSYKIFPQEFPTRFSQKIFPSRILIGWLHITLFQILNFHQSLPLLNWLFPSTLFYKIFLQDFPTRISCKIFPQDFPELDPDWLAPHHPIPNANFPPITAFLKLAFSPQPCPARFQTDFPARFTVEFPARFSHMNFPQDFFCKNFLLEFPTRFSCKIFPQDFPELDPDWLAPHHPIQNAKFPLITAFLQLAFPPQPCPARFSHKIFHKNFPQEIPTRFFLAGS